MENRPKLTLTLTPFDIAVEAAGVIVMGLMWYFTLTNYENLPDRIPGHFNAAGVVDAYSGKNSIFLLPIIGTVLYIGLSFISRFPHIYNYPFNLNEDNVLEQYTLASRMVRTITFTIVSVFLYIIYQTIQTAMGKANGLGRWTLPVVLLLIGVPIAYYLWRAMRGKTRVIEEE